VVAVRRQDHGVLLMRGLLVALALVIAAASSPRAAADGAGFVVIVNPKNAATRLDKKFVADIFLKKQTHWSDDSTIKPVDQARTSAVRARFSEEILGRSIASVRTYWNQVVFSGQGVPPPELDSDASVVKYVLGNQTAIGYVSPTAELEGAKVVQVR
jgi:ABC-type phosphate transport system substrate-binding protein